MSIMNPSQHSGAMLGSSSPPSRTYVNYVLLMLFLVAALNVCDRTIVAVLAEDIRLDLKLDDRQMGLVMGLAFSVTYILAGIPLARLADTRSRRAIIAAAVAGWSVMTMLGGAAQNFFQLVLTRMGVGIGEAGGSPPSHSLVTDYVAPQFRARALSILGIGAVAGMGIGTLYGGWASDIMGWRLTLFSVGLPGLLLAVMFLLTVREPARRVDQQAPQDRLAGAGIGAVVKALFCDPRFILLAIGAGLVSMVGMGKGFWEPTFLRRVYGLSAGEAGRWYFVMGPIPAVLGGYALSILTDRLAHRDIRWYAWMAGLSALAAAPLAIAFYLLPTTWLVMGIPVAFLFSFASSLVGGAWMPAVAALAQSIAPPSARAVAAASWGMAGNIGTGLGPLLVGDINMRLQGTQGEDSVRFSLTIVACLSLIAVPIFVALGRAVGRKAKVSPTKTSE